MKENWKLIYDMTESDCDRIVDSILSYRGVKNKQEFLHPTNKYLLPYEDLKNINKSFSLIKYAIDNNKKIMIHGDVDTDGCTSAAIIYRYLKHFTDNITLYINEGKIHGLKDDVNLTNIELIIEVDSINDATDYYQELLNSGINLIVMDHHIVSSEVLKINEDICLVSSAVNYGNPALSGAGVVWKCCMYYDTQFGTTYANDLVDLAAVGIVADMCDVSEKSMENRFIVDWGIKNVVNPAIKQIVGKYEYNAKTISFSIAPIVNSANRLSNNKEALQLFILDDDEVISEMIDSLKKYKDGQNELVRTIYESKIIPNVDAQKDRKCLFFEVDGDRNFAGLIANKCVGDYKKPTIVYKTNSELGVCEGSMRAVGVDSFLDIVNKLGIAECAGHENAAGFTCPLDRFEEFKDELELSLQNIDFDISTWVDIKLNISQLSNRLVKKLKELNRVSGYGFKEVVVLIENIKNFEVARMSKGLHMKVKAGDLSFIKWKIPNWDSVYESGVFSAIGVLDTESYGTGYQMILNDFIFENPDTNSLGTLWG